MTIRCAPSPRLGACLLAVIAVTSTVLLTASPGSGATRRVAAGSWTMRALLDQVVPEPTAESDGRRWVVISGGNPAVPVGGFGGGFVYDTLTGKLTPTPFPGECGPGTIGVSGVLLLICQSPGNYWRGYVLDLRTGAMREVPHVIPATTVGFGSVGRRWVVYTESCDPETFDCVKFAVNLRTGKRRPYSNLRMDLDSTDLRLLPLPLYSTSTRGSHRIGSMSTLWLRDPSHHRILLDRCPHYECEGQISAGRVIWNEGLVAKGYVIATGRRYSHRFAVVPGLGDNGDHRFEIQVSTTRYRVIVTRSLPSNAGSRGSVYQARW